MVFDEGRSASSYRRVVRSIAAARGHVMGELLDSSALRGYSTAAYLRRADDYLHAFGHRVDVWEVGNEVNGAWTGAPRSTAAKIVGAYDKVVARGGRTALTLWYGPHCSERGEDPFAWSRRYLPRRVRRTAGWVLVSYWAEDCRGIDYRLGHWIRVFRRLRAIYPRARLGFGEIGTRLGASPESSETEARHYYGMFSALQAAVPGFIGGGFWWYWHEQATPWDQKALWSTIDAAFAEY